MGGKVEESFIQISQSLRGSCSVLFHQHGCTGSTNDHTTDIANYTANATAIRDTFNLQLLGST